MMSDLEQITALRISLASPEQIRAWSYGEVSRPETINYRTLKPVPDGLFCERIFGPEKDWTCSCGKYHKARSAWIICEKCGVEVAPSRLRRERMGHIELACPVVHPWYANSIALLLGITPRQLAGILSHTLYIVSELSEAERLRERARLEAELSFLYEQDVLDFEQAKRFRSTLRALDSLCVGMCLSEERYRFLQNACPGIFRAGAGATTVQAVLSALDLESLAQVLRTHAGASAGKQQKKAAKRLEVVEAFRQGGVNPAWMVLSVLPVLPAGLRPMVPLSGGRKATSDVNDLYLRVIHRNSRVRSLKEKGAPALILRYEERLLQGAVNALFDNRHCRRPILGPKHYPLKSLSDRLDRKMGRFRRTLLGKRVDYSGRSVICVGLELSLHQCGLPKKLALELFKPFVMRKLVERNLASSVRGAKRLVERGKDAPAAVWDQLEEVMMEHPVLLNRAPTLHRLSIQAFEPILVEGDAIQLHPLVCSAYNADFDGDQMAVHLPLSDQACSEAYRLLLSTATLRSPATGDPSITLGQEIVLGCFYLTEVWPEKKGEGRTFSDMTEAMLAYDHGVIDLQANIRVRLLETTIYDAPPPACPQKVAGNALVETTVGRLMFNAALPERLRFRNYAMKKEHLKQLTASCLQELGPQETARMADALKRLGFHFATRSGTSIAMSDIDIPPEREALLAGGDRRVEEVEELWRSGMVSAEERYRQIVSIWSEVTEEVTCCVERTLNQDGPIAIIANSGATKAKFQQIRQLSGMRGLMASPSGRIIEIPIRGNYKQGLSVAEYLIGSHGARKGVIDRSLNTATAGYRTIILVEVGRTVTVTEEDCGEQIGMLITNVESRAMGLPDMRSRIVSRVLAQAISTGFPLPAGTELSGPLVEELLKAGVDACYVRSPITCHARRGICRRCYGLDLSSGKLVERRAAVGIIAAQSIGEPGTQLTMRTFHSGGIAGAQGDITTAGLPRINEVFEARAPNHVAVLAEIAGSVDISPSTTSQPTTIRVRASEVVYEDYPLPPGCQIMVQAGDAARAGSPLALDERGQAVIVARTDGVIHLEGGLLSLRSVARDERCYQIPAGRKVVVQSGEEVLAGTALSAGLASPADILRISGEVAAARYLVAEVQAVFRTTGVFLHDKHIELIARQMLRWVVVDDPGDTTLIPQSLYDRFSCCEASASALAQGGRPALAHLVLLGTRSVALHNESWLSAAAFQQTRRILATAAIAGKTDHLQSSKGNIIVGRKLSFH